MFIHPSKRYRLYIDETGTQTLKQAHTDRFLCLTGLVMRQDAHDGAFTVAMDSIKDELFNQTPTSPVIFHRREMVRGEGIFERLQSDPLFAMEFEQRWLDLLDKSQFIVIAGAIDKKAHKEKYKVWQHDPYHYCLQVLVERFVMWCKRHKFCGDVLIESRDKWADKRLKAAYSHFYHNGEGRVSALDAQACLTTKEIKFARKSDNVAAHQLADSLAHPVLRYLKSQHLGEPPAVGFGNRLVEKLLLDRFARHPKTRVISGWGHKWLPE